MAETSSSRFQSLWQDDISKSALRLSLILFFSLVVLVCLFFWRLPPEIPLFYSRPWGMAQLVTPYFLFIVLLITAVFVLINIFFASLFFDNFKLLSRIILWSSFLSELILVIAVIKMISLVF